MTNEQIDFIEASAIPENVITDWYITSVSQNDLPVWTEEHITELCNDFYLIPKKDNQKYFYGKTDIEEINNYFNRNNNRNNNHSIKSNI